MATPTVTNIYPNTGHTGGGAVIRILGGNFREPPDPMTLTRDDPTPGPTVRVTFGGVPAEYVAVVNRALMYVRTPRSPISADRTGDASGRVDVQVTNLDEDGEPIPGETVTVKNAFTYNYTKLTGDSSLQRLVRWLLREMRRQIIPNVVYMPHSDYDNDTSDGLQIVEIASVPSLALVGPQVVRSVDHSTSSPEYVQAHQNQVSRHADFRADLSFTVIGTTDSTVHHLNLQAETISFFHRLGAIRVPRDPNDASAGYNEYAISVATDGPASVDLGSDDSNLRTFSQRFAVLGFPIMGRASFPDASNGGLEITAPVHEIDLTVEQLSDEL